MANPLTDWNYNSNSGAVQEIPKIASAVLRSAGTGWHGPFASKAEALAYYTNNHSANPGWKAPAGWAENVGNIADFGATKVGNAIQDTFGGLNLSAWFIRVGEIFLGIVLVGVGIAKLTGTANVISKAAKVAVKGAVL